MILDSACKLFQENQAIAWFLKTKEKNPPKQLTLDFLERTVHRVGEKAENQRKTREKSKVPENHVFWLDLCAKNKDCAYTLRNKAYFSVHRHMVQKPFPANPLIAKTKHMKPK